MPRQPRKRWFISLCSLMLVVVLVFTMGVSQPRERSPRSDPEAAALERLRAMPLELRREYAKRLREFQTLPKADQSRLTELDTYLQSLPPDRRHQLTEDLARYRAWLASLDDKLRQKILSAPTPDAFEALLRSHYEPATPVVDLPTFAARDGSAPPISGLGGLLGKSPDRKDRESGRRYFDELGRFSPINQAILIKCWNRLTPDERATLPNPKLQAEEFTRQLISTASRFGFNAEHELDALASRLPRIEKDRVLNIRSTLADRIAKAKSTIPFPRRGWMELGMLEAMILSRLPLPKVSDSDLSAFYRELPEWVQDDFDHLAPESAHKALLLLYQQLQLVKDDNQPEPPDPNRS